jgi:hypothetical protein
MVSGTATSRSYGSAHPEQDAQDCWCRGEFVNKFAAIAVSTATLAVVVLNGGVATAKGGGSSGGGTPAGGTPAGASTGAWPAALPLPTNPGTVLSQSSSTAVVRSTDTVLIVHGKLDALYVTQMGCTSKAAVNKPRDYFCKNPATGKTVEVFFTFAALDPKPTDPSRSQSNAFLVLS